MSVKYVDHRYWDNDDNIENVEYEYADTGMSHFMCPTQWIKQNFIPLSNYKLPNINPLAEIAKYRREHTS